MGLLVDRLAETIGGLHRLQLQLVQRGRAVEAAQIQHDLVERLQQVVLQIDGSSVDTEADGEAAIEAAKQGRKRPGRLCWSCCGEPRRIASRRGKPIWVAECNWKKGKRQGRMLRLVSQGASKPRAVRLGGRRLRRCTPVPTK